MEKISVIVPCYNQAEFMAETLDSVFAQTYENWECIIVNDGSSDNTAEIACAYLRKDSRYKYYYQENKGLPSARNYAISKSVGDYILPLDSDDLIAPSYLEKAVMYFRKHPETKLVYCKARFFGERNDEWILPPYKYENLLWDNCIFCSAIFKRGDFLKTRGYNENMRLGFEDWDFWLTILEKEDRVCQLDEILFFYRIKSFSLSTITSANRDELYIQIYRNHSDLYAPYAERIILLYNSSHVVDLMKENLLLKSQLKNVTNSKIYRVVKFLSFRWNKLKMICRHK